MKGIWFGTNHSYNKWGLVLTDKKISSPEPKVKQIEIEGSDGMLDLTDFFGKVKYKNRSLSFTFKTVNASQKDFLALYSEVQNEIHGKTLQVILDDDPQHFYYGRVTINEWKSNKSIGEIIIDVDAEPWKREVTDTQSTWEINGTSTITLTNGKMPVVPTVTNTDSVTITFNGHTGTYPANSTEIPELELTEGTNRMTVNGTGTITFAYRKGWL